MDDNEKPPRTVGVNQRGNRIGEHHHNAKLTDHDVDLMRRLHEEGWTYHELADKFECSNSTIRDIIFLRRRAQFVARFIRVRVKPKK